MYDNTIPWDTNCKITQSFAYNLEPTLKQGYFLNKNMTLTAMEGFTYYFYTAQYYISFNKNTNQVVVSKQDIIDEKIVEETLFNGKIKTEKEMEVLLDQLSIKL